MAEEIWDGEADAPAALAEHIAEAASHVVRLPGVEPIRLVSLTMSVANRAVVVSALRAAERKQ
jgi:hypothetical protein